MANPDQPLAGAGVLLRASDGRVLFMRRAADARSYPGAWDFPGGGAEVGEVAADAARRELAEETGYTCDADLSEALLTRSSRYGCDFSTFTADCGEIFAPAMDDGEHDAYVWAKPEDAPAPLHPGVRDTLVQMRRPMAGDRAIPGLAYDRFVFGPETSARRYDADGRLHVAKARISKANICPYVGYEIPGSEELGLDPDKVYQLYRDPEELAKGAETFNNLPLLRQHVPVSAEEPMTEEIVGSLGTDAAFENPYLTNSLVVWNGDAIEQIESNRKKELSSGYRYRPDMTPGTANGEPYDGVMRDIVGNHVAIVKEGRAGPDVVIGDEIPHLFRGFHMTKNLLSRRAAYVQGAVSAYLHPRLAQDAKIDLTPVVAGLTSENFRSRKSALSASIKSAVRGKLAQDANLADLDKFLDGLGQVPVAEGKDAGGEEPPPAYPPDANAAPAPAAKPAAPKPPTPEGKDADPLAKVREFLSGKLSPEDMAQLDALVSAGAADELEIDDDYGDRVSGDEDVEGEPKPPIDGAEGAMDAKAIARIRKQAADEAIARVNAVHSAREAVRPYVGALVQAFDSADAVYATALKALGVQITGVHPSAYPALLAMAPKRGETAARKPAVASDAAREKSFAERFPSTARIRVI